MFYNIGPRSWIVDEDLKNISDPSKSGSSVRRIKVGSDGWTKHLEGIRTNGSAILVAFSNEFGTDFVGGTTGSVVAIKLKMIETANVKTVDEKVDQTESVERKRDETKRRIEKLVSKVGQPVLVKVSGCRTYKTFLSVIYGFS